MFNTISPTYDLINRVLSLGLDQWWRRRVTRFLPSQEKISLLDVATGTGDQLFTLMERAKNIGEAVGVDPAQEMLHLAEVKSRNKSYHPQTKWIQASAESLPFADKIFDVATISFGIRNVPDPVTAMQEIRRTLKDKGVLLVLEFSKPRRRWLQACHLWYLRHILPKVGGFLSKNRAAYQYLNTTIEGFPSGSKFCQLMEEAGYKGVEAHPLTWGVVTLYRGVK